MLRKRFPRAARGSVGRGGAGGGRTNLKRTVTSPRRAFPHCSSRSGSTWTSPARFARPSAASAPKSAAPAGAWTRPSIASSKTSANSPACTRKSVNDSGRSDCGTTKVLRAPVPMETGSRFRRSRSSTILPRWMMPIRRALAWARAIAGLERLSLDRLGDLGEEGVRALEVADVQVGARHEEHGLGLLDLALDLHLLEPEDFRLRRRRGLRGPRRAPRLGGGGARERHR